MNRERTLSHIAAVFAVSNLGMMTYLNDPVGEPSRWDDTPENEVENIAGHLMESDDHEAIFGGEARMWYNKIKDLSFGEIVEQYHYNDWVTNIIEAAEESAIK
jgi:hypothetical protein